MKKQSAAWIVMSGATLIIALTYRVHTHREAAAQPPKPTVVKTIKVETRRVPDFIEASGKVQASLTAEVRPQANGVLRAVRIKDGERVREGQLLFSIDEQPLRAALAQARSAYTRDEALAIDAQQTEARLRPLVAKHYVSDKDYQTARNSMLSLEAAAAASKALVDEATIALGYADVRAPIAGLAGAVLVKAGNLVSASQTTPLVVINVASPADIDFSMPQQQVDRLRTAQSASDSDGPDVIALNAVTAEERGRGKLSFTDNAFDDTSGTLAMRARFANANESLWPGEFVTVRIILAETPDALTVPESALQQGQQGPYVYCLRSGKASLQLVSVARLVDSRAVITKGLSSGDVVVLAVPTTLRDGADVTSEDGGATPSASGLNAARKKDDPSDQQSADASARVGESM